MILAIPVVGWSQNTLPDIDLTNNGLYLRSMLEKSWAPVGPHQDVSMGNCGCLLAAAATLSGIKLLNPGQVSGFLAVPLDDSADPFWDGTFSPLYEHDFLYSPNNVTPLLADSPAWGYKPLRPKTCGVMFPPWALTREANPVILTNGTGGFTTGPSGFDWTAYKGWDFIAQLIVNQNLLNGLPTVVTIKLPSNQCFGRNDCFHAQLIAGWDSATQRYLIVDPVNPPGTLPEFPVGDTKGTYADWENQIDSIMSFHPDTFGSLSYLALVDDPSPVRFLVIAPDGRRTGFDPGTQTFVNEDSNVSYAELGAWADPLGEIPPGPLASFLTLRGAPAGTYRFEVYGSANGTATYSFDAIDQRGKTNLGGLSDVISAGEVRKYEVQYAPGGTSTVAQVSSFKPQVVVGNGIGTRPGAAVQLDGSRSFSVEGNIVSFQWDFGDGITGTGGQLSHTYSAPGTYLATLTVTDDQGNTASAMQTVDVISPFATPTLQLVNLASSGALANAPTSYPPFISADGRYVAFASVATNLLPSNANADIFVRDTLANTTDPIPSSGFSFPEAISADGRFVLFYSVASNLVPNCSACANGGLYLRDRQQQTTEFVVDPTPGVSANFYGADLSSDGRYAVYVGDPRNSGYPLFQNTSEIFLKDRQTGTTELISVSVNGQRSNSSNDFPRVSPDGRFVLFANCGNSNSQNVLGATCGASDLLSPSVGVQAVYLRDRLNGTTEVVSLTNAGGPVASASYGRGSLSADGRFIAFAASNNSIPSIAPNDPAYYITFVYLRDRLNHSTRNVSVSSSGGGSIGSFAYTRSDSPSLSADARYVAFVSNSPLVPQKLVPPYIFDVFRHDLVTGETVAITHTANTNSPFAINPAISADGQSIAFISNDTDLVPQTQNAQQQSNVFKSAILGSSKPVANLSGPYLGWASSNDVPSFVQFDGSQSFDPLGQALTAKWDFGDGSPVLTATGAGQVLHSYSAPGTYALKLLVNNGTTDSDSATTTVTILSALHADSVVATPSCADPGGNVRISGMASSDNPAKLGGWNLAQGALTPAAIQVQDFNGTRTVTPSASDFSFAFTTTVPTQASGAYRFGLAPGPTATVNVPCSTPTDVPPIANAGGPYTSGIGQPITFDGSLSSDAKNRPLTYRWSFGDGTQGTGVSPQHAYAHQGTHVVQLVVNNGVTQSHSAFGSHSFAKVTVLADTIPPTTTAVLSPLANANGWNNSNVTLTLTAVDEPGGTGVKQITYSASGAQSIASTVANSASTSLTISTEGITTITFFGTDNAANIEAAKTVTIKLDKTPPQITDSRTPPANQYGWNNSNVTVSFACSDSLSGLAPGSGPIDAVVSAEGANQSVTGACQDVAGNSASATVSGINVDKTPPTITGSRAPAANSFGWNNTDVTVSFACADFLSGVDTCGPSPQIVTSEGLNQSRIGTAVDLAGNRATAVVGNLNIDKTPPSISCTANPSVLWPPDNKLVSVTVSVSLSDSLSGTAGFTLVSATSNEPDSGLGDIQGFAAGTASTSGQLRAQRLGSGNGRVYTLKYSGTDRAGNSATCSTTVSVPHDQGQWPPP
jgi:PKD repeat protein